MAEPRSAQKFDTRFPTGDPGWAVPIALAGGAPEVQADAKTLLSVHVAVRVVPGGEGAFLAASLENARNSVREPGVARFDVVQDQEDPTRFCLVEVYRTAEAPAAHKETSHYAAWRDAVAD